MTRSPDLTADERSKRYRALPLTLLAAIPND